MAVSSVNNSGFAQNAFTSTQVDRTTGELGKDQFLNLLVTQLKYQDPLNPVDDKEFIAQMAQFTSLEQMKNISDTFSTMKAFTLVGKHVKATIVDEKTKLTREIEGDVESVRVVNKKAYVVVNGRDIPVDNVTDVSDVVKAEPQQSLTEIAHLIGSLVTGKLKNSSGNITYIAGIAAKVSSIDGQNVVHLDGAVFDVYELPDLRDNSPEAVMEYIEKRLDEGKTNITIMVKDPTNDAKFTIQGALMARPEIVNGKVRVVLGDIKLPVDDITDISVYVPSYGEAEDETGNDGTTETDETADSSAVLETDPVSGETPETEEIWDSEG